MTAKIRHKSPQLRPDTGILLQSLRAVREKTDVFLEQCELATKPVITEFRNALPPRFGPAFIGSLRRTLEIAEGIIEPKIPRAHQVTALVREIQNRAQGLRDKDPVMMEAFGSEPGTRKWMSKIERLGPVPGNIEAWTDIVCGLAWCDPIWHSALKPTGALYEEIASSAVRSRRAKSEKRFSSRMKFDHRPILPADFLRLATDDKFSVKKRRRDGSWEVLNHADATHQTNAAQKTCGLAPTESELKAQLRTNVRLRLVTLSKRPQQAA